MLTSKPSICSFGFSMFPTTWGICFSLKAYPNRAKALGSSPVLAQVDLRTGKVKPLVTQFELSPKVCEISRDWILREDNL
jgi:hypothetical protein